MVTPGQLLIVEDTMLNGHPVHQDFGPGPMEALDTFLSETDDFTIDAIGEKFLVSFNPRGYLRRA
jgi:cephalosporin hydroxylase